MHRMSNPLKGLGENSLLNRFELFVIVVATFITISGYIFYKTIKTMNQFKSEAIILQAKVDALESHLGSRFAYVTADMDAAKTQIRELNSQVTRLNSNGLKLINFLENKNIGKNAQRH